MLSESADDLADAHGWDRGWVGLVLRPQGRVLRVGSWISIALAAVYLMNAVLVALAEA